jgi:chemotaxis protein MotB
MRPPSPSGTSAYGPEGYVVGFGQHEPESLEEQRARLQQHAGKYDPPQGDDDDLGENDWTVTYTDMVTLLMAFFVILTAIAVAGAKDVKQTEDIPPPSQIEGVATGTGPSSPFDGQGFSITVEGAPANRDPIDSRYDDPDVENPSTTDPAPSGEGISANPTPLHSTPVPQPPPAQSAENAQLAQDLKAMVQQNNFGSQVEVISGADTVTLRISEKILFPSGRATLEDSGSALVEKLSTILASSNGQISIEGHTDTVPISTVLYPSNWELSAARAAMVLRQLVDRGLPANRLRAIAYADTKPVADNTSPEGKAANRRVELVISSASGQ